MYACTLLLRTSVPVSSLSQVNKRAKLVAHAHTTLYTHTIHRTGDCWLLNWMPPILLLLLLLLQQHCTQLLTALLLLLLVMVVLVLQQ
jgi:hypothetical protein